MKHTLLPLILAIAVLGACKKDNREPPKSTLDGMVVITGTKTPVGVQSNGTQLELWQDGYALRQKIPVYIDHTGLFSAKLFDGRYKMVRLTGAPWKTDTDTITIDLKGHAVVEVPVVPFFTVGGETITYNAADTSITAVFTISRMDATKTADRVSLHLGQTIIVDANNQIPFNGPAAINDLAPAGTYLTAPTTIKVYLNPARHPNFKDGQGRDVSNAELRRQLTDILAKKYTFARVAVKTTNVTQRMYSQVKQIKLQ
jgi:hypothetical protein